MRPLLANSRAVFFDAVGTLIHPEPTAADVYAHVGRRFGSRLAAPDIAARFARAFARHEEADRRDRLRTSEEREVRRWREIVAEVLDDVTDPARCFVELYQHFARPEAWRCEPEVAGVLDELARRGLALGLASNYDYRLRSVLAGRPELHAARHVVISSEVGWRKPAPEFFAAVCRVAGLPAGRILFVGDDRHNDYDGARAAGLRAVLLDPRGRQGDVPHRLRSLAELLTAIRPETTS
jgi:putative hydrolase of the HAD superfamily